MINNCNRHRVELIHARQLRPLHCKRQLNIGMARRHQWQLV